MDFVDMLISTRKQSRAIKASRSCLSSKGGAGLVPVETLSRPTKRKPLTSANWASREQL